jgi:hypothetical protein
MHHHSIVVQEQQSCEVGHMGVGGPVIEDQLRLAAAKHGCNTSK